MAVKKGKHEGPARKINEKKSRCRKDFPELYKTLKNSGRVDKLAIEFKRGQI